MNFEKLKENLVSNNLNGEIIKVLFEILESEEIFKEYKEDDVLLFKVKDEKFESEILIPTIMKILKNDYTREKFLDEIERRLSDSNKDEEMILLEILIKNINENQFKYLFQGVYERIFNILLKTNAKDSNLYNGFWSWKFEDYIGEVLSSIYKKRLIESIRSGDLKEFLYLSEFSNFNILNEKDAISLIEDYNMIEFLIDGFSRLEKKDRDCILIPEFGLQMTKKFFNYIKEHVGERVRKILIRKDYDEISLLLHLHLHDFLENNEIDNLYLDYNYIIYVHSKQANYLSEHLEKYNGDAKKALLSWANEFEDYSDIIEKLIKIFEGKELIVLDVQGPYILLDGDGETLEKAVAEKLIEKDEIPIFYK